MKVRLASVALTVVGLLSASAAARAAALPVEVKLSAIRCIQNYKLDVRTPDQVYAYVTGVAKGQPVDVRIPKDGMLKSLPKEPPLTEETPLWKGELAEGEFAVLSFALFQQAEGDKSGDATPVKKLIDDITAADKAAVGDKKTLTAADVKAVAEKALKSQQEIVTAATNKVSGALTREKGSEHFNGLFTVVLLNDGGKLVKRLDPVGLTFGEHYGTNEKLYTKLKRTRSNVPIKDDSGQFFPQQLEPLSDDKATIRVKMDEVEYVKNPKRNNQLQNNVTDYLVELQVVAGGKPVTWALQGEVPSDKSLVHVYWNWAE
jgi:hypothetical protein